MTATPLGLIYPYEAQCPVVDDLGDKYRVYYGRRDNQNRSKIFYIECNKNDLSKWEQTQQLPIVNLGEEGSFDEDGQIPSSIGIWKGVKYLYFTGVKTGFKNRFENSVGAIKILHERFIKIREPIIIPETRELFNSHLMYQGNGVATYCSCREWQNNEPIYDIRLCTTNGDGINWYKHPGIELKLLAGEGGICSFNVFDNKAIFCVRDKIDYRGGCGSYRLETAEWNYVDKWIRTGRLEIERDSWCNEMQCYPYLIDNHLFYNGNGFGKTGIGLARLS